LSHVLKATFTRLIGFIDILNHMGGKAELKFQYRIGQRDVLKWVLEE
jgi:hypothetical protein